MKMGAIVGLIGIAAAALAPSVTSAGASAKPKRAAVHRVCIARGTPFALSLARCGARGPSPSID